MSDRERAQTQWREDGERATGVAAGLASPLEVTIRELSTQAEYVACIGLQYATWGEGYREAVPVSVLKVTQKVGGIAAGAFHASGRMVGFVYGLTGYEGGVGVHWSHMLAVDPSARDRGVGRLLKRYQRERLRAAGVGRVRWSFDPLFARNAHLNVNVLGARLVDYVVDMYPDTGSALHTFGTDRFVAEWGLEDGAGEAGAETRSAGDAVTDGESNRGVVGAELEAGAIDEERVEIPVDAESMRGTALMELRAWRESTRAALTGLLSSGYTVTGFRRAVGRCHYVLTARQV